MAGWQSVKMSTSVSREVQGEDGARDFGFMLALGTEVLRSTRSPPPPLHTPPSNADPSVYTQKPPRRVISSISAHARSLDGAMRVDREGP